MAVQWLGPGAFTAEAWVQSLAGELRSCKPHSGAKKEEEKKLNKQTKLCLVLLSLVYSAQSFWWLFRMGTTWPLRPLTSFMPVTRIVRVPSSAKPALMRKASKLFALSGSSSLPPGLTKP